MKILHTLKFINLVLALVALIFAFAHASWNLSVETPLMQVIGNIHPLFLHLPIGGLVFLVLLDVSNKIRWIKLDSTAIFAICVFTCLFANLSFFTGYLLGFQGGYSEELLRNHLWAAAIYVIALAAANFITGIKTTTLKHTAAYYSSLLVAIVSMSVAGHYGGLMTHGDPFAPLAKKTPPPKVDLDKPTTERLVFEEVVMPILSEKCFSCHGNGKKKSKLALDTYELMLKGGASGDPTLVPGDSKNSMLISTLLLPMDDDLHMPPENKPQMSKEEIQILTWWVENGAQQKKTLAETDAPSEIIAAIESLVPEEVRQEREIKRLESIAQQKAKAKTERKALHEQMKQSLSKKVLPLVRFISTDDASIHISSVSLRDQFTDEDFASLQLLAPQITALDLSHSSISNSSIPLITECSQLESLRLAGTQLNSTDISPLASLSKLKTLSLHSTMVDKAALQTFAKLKSLEKLHLWNTKLSKAEIEQFKKEHPNLHITY